MTVRRDGDVIRLEGDCPVEDAEMLVGLLEGGVGRTMDLSQCGSAHSAIIQSLFGSDRCCKERRKVLSSGR